MLKHNKTVSSHNIITLNNKSKMYKFTALYDNLYSLLKKVLKREIRLEDWHAHMKTELTQTLKILP